MAPEAPRYTVRKYYNTLVRDCYQDGAPSSAFVGREMINNDRFLSTQLRRTVCNMGFTLSSGGTDASLDLPISDEWRFAPPVEHMVTPGARNIKMVVTANIPQNMSLDLICYSSTRPRRVTNNAFSGGTLYTLSGTGAETTYTKSGANDGDELIAPAASGTTDRFQFGFRLNEQRALAEVDPVISTLISTASEDGLTLITTAGLALAALPENLTGYSFGIWSSGANLYVWGPGAGASSCNQANTFNAS